MHDEHLYTTYESIPYDEVSDILSISSLPSNAIVRNRDATKLMETTPDEDIVTVAPVSLATSYQLGKEPLTAVKLSHVSEVETNSVSLSEFRILVRGSPQARLNHSLAEYT
jgi:hypothetical protein